MNHSWMCLLIVVTLVSGARGETGAAAGTGKTVSLSVLARLSVEDVPGHELVQSTGLDEFTTPDPIEGVSFEGAHLRTHNQADLADGSGLVRGYGVWEARTGEKLFLVYGYRVPPIPAGASSVVAFDGSFEWIGGTGALTGVRGKGRIEGQIDRGGRATYRWDGTWQRVTQ